MGSKILWKKKNPDNVTNVNSLQSQINLKPILNLEKDQISFLQGVLKDPSSYQVYLSENNKYLIVVCFNKYFVHNCVFNLEKGKLILESKDVHKLESNYDFSNNPNKTWARIIGRTTMLIDNKTNVIAFILDKNLPPIKYEDHKKWINNEISKKLPKKEPLMSNSTRYLILKLLWILTNMGKNSLEYML